MAIWVPIVGAVILALIGTIWLTLSKRVEKHGDKLEEHEGRLERGDEKMEALDEIKGDLKTVLREQSKMDVKIARIETKVFES
jgi:hypothetical protein